MIDLLIALIAVIAAASSGWSDAQVFLLAAALIGLKGGLSIYYGVKMGQGEA